ncbi:MAG TPA: efflux RND transporter periplasmic adaptor subunit [Vicinamibacterales bacterium]|nr:efflux RND transporter periplasmic adaptor subunit [Vicinamibacterales bacterium]
MTVETTTTTRLDVAERVTVVGNLIGAATVAVVPKVSGRIESVNVRLGDPVRRGQLLATLEDRELREQVRQTEASLDVSRATVRQREADLKNAQSNLERSRNLFGRSLIAQQTLDDAEARYDAAVAQVDLARAQGSQATARLEELRINLSNTRILSPVDGFVGSRSLDAGAFVGTNSSFLSVVDIHFVRLVANLVEKDLRRIVIDMPAVVEVDAYPGETFAGRVARLAPVLDPATRTAQMEVEVPNAGARLKPGMYARVEFVVAQRAGALTVPRNAIVDLDGTRGVFVADGKTARFKPITSGIVDGEAVEITEGLADASTVITLGSASLRDGDPIVIAGQQAGRGARGGAPAEGGGRGPRPGGGA